MELIPISTYIFFHLYFNQIEFFLLTNFYKLNTWLLNGQWNLSFRVLSCPHIWFFLTNFFLLLWGDSITPFIGLWLDWRKRHICSRVRQVLSKTFLTLLYIDMYNLNISIYTFMSMLKLCMCVYVDSNIHIYIYVILLSSYLTVK